MKKNVKNWLYGGIFFVLLGIFAFYSGILQESLPSNVQLAIPHYGSFECKAYPEKLGQVITIPSSGVFLSKETIGFYTNGIKNIKTSVDYSFWTSVVKDLRLRYSICDSNGANCGSDKIIKYSAPGTRFDLINSIDFSSQSLRVYFEQQTILNYFSGTWTPYSGATLSYDATPYKLVYHSTTQDVAGAIVCSTSCDLTCHDIGTRQPLTFANVDVLDFGATAPSFEYWDSISYDLNSQGGATVYNANTRTFCFSGTVYSANTLTTQYGNSYIFPDVNTKQTHVCCPGAKISSTYSDKVCQSDYTWKTIAKSDNLACISDAVCPNAGNSICQNKQLSNGYSCVNKDANGVGRCEVANGKAVSCCLSSDCNKDMTCDLSTHTCKGGTIYPTCGDGNVDSGEQCDDGNSVSGDGCSSICQIEQSGCPSGFNKCSDGTCQSVCSESCQALAFGLVPANKGTVTECNFGCQLTKTVTFGLVDNTKSTATCIYDYSLIIILGIVFIIGLIIVTLMGKGKRKGGVKVSNKTIKWSIFIILGAVAFYFLWAYILWVIVGLIVLSLLDTFVLGGVIKKVLFK